MNNPGRPRFYWEVDMEEVEMGPKIGQGAFGGTYTATQSTKHLPTRLRL